MVPSQEMFLPQTGEFQVGHARALQGLVNHAKPRPSQSCQLHNSRMQERLQRSRHRLQHCALRGLVSKTHLRVDVILTFSARSALLHPTPLLVVLEAAQALSWATPLHSPTPTLK